MDKWSTPVARTCELCSSSFQVQYQSVVRGQGRFCRKCKPAHNKGQFKSEFGHSCTLINKTCLTCGATFKVQVKQLSKGGGGYCSKRCNPVYHPWTQGSKYRKHNLKKYGLTPETYNVLAESQHNLCAICGNPPNIKCDKHFNLHVDHDHKTGAVRGLLCTKCNMGLGLFNDSQEQMLMAIKYLQKQTEGKV